MVKANKFFISALALCATGVVAMAQDADLANGVYFLRNKANGKFISCGEAWGTRTIFLADGSNAGAKFTATKVEGDTYTFTSNINGNGKALNPENAFIDGPADGKWTVTKVDGGYTLYSTTREGDVKEGYYSAVANSELPNFTTTADENSVWEFVTEAELMSAMDNAGKEAPVEVSFLIKDAEFRKGDPEAGAWKGGPAITDGVRGNKGNATINNYAAEMYDKGNFDVYQVIENLPNGIYAVALKASYREGDAQKTVGGALTYPAAEIFESKSYTVPVAYAKTAIRERTAEVKHMFEKAAETKENDTWFWESKGADRSYFAPNNVETICQAFDDDFFTIKIENMVVTDGTLTIGIKRTGTAVADWTAFDRFRLYYYGEKPTNITENAAAEKTVVAIYSITGAQIPELQKGINIVKYSDGSSKKVPVK